MAAECEHTNTNSTESVRLAHEYQRAFDRVYREHEQLRAECDRRLNNAEGPHYDPFDARCNPSKAKRDAYIETAGFRNRFYPEKKFLDQRAAEAEANAARLRALEETKRRREADGDSEGAAQVEDEIYEELEGTARIKQKLVSSNLDFYLAQWHTATRECRHVTALSKKFYWLEQRYKTSSTWGSPEKATDACAKKPAGRPGGKVWGPWRIWELDSAPVEEQRSMQTTDDEVGIVRRETTVDIVCENHAEWVKTTNITNRRVVMALADIGIGLDDLDDEDDCDGGDDGGDRGQSDAEDARPWLLRRIENGWVAPFLRDVEEDGELLDLLKFAVQLSKAAPANRAHAKPPHIRFVCPRLVEHENAMVDRVLQDVRGLGITVDTATTGARFLKHIGESDEDPTPLTPAIFARMMPNPYELLDDKLNLDCTVLIGLASDISHLKSPQVEAGYATAIKAQIEAERQHSLLVSQLFPIVDGRQLCCTHEAAERFCSIASIMATTAEKQRTALLVERWLGHAADMEGYAARVAQMSPRERLDELRRLSDYEIPDTLQLPVRIIPDAESTISRALEAGREPASARPKRLSPTTPWLPPIAETIPLHDINRSVFLFSWTTGLMTVTSNRVAAKAIQLTLESHMTATGEDLPNPALWVTDIARSFITKGAKLDGPKCERDDQVSEPATASLQ